MIPEPATPSLEQDLFRNRLDNLVDPDHALSQLANLIDWSRLDDEFGSPCSPDRGCPGKSVRLMAGLQYLKHAFDLSGEEAVARWTRNPYWQ